MNQTAEQIIQQIIQQTKLPREEVLERIEQLKHSLKYELEEPRGMRVDPTIPQLLAQEIGVDLGDPSNYLYVELLFDKYPQFARIIPFVTVDKAKIKKILGRHVEKPKTWTPREDEVAPVILAVEPTFMRDGILFHYKEYNTAIKYSLEEIIDQAELYRTFTDYRIERTSDPEKTYLPYSIVGKVAYHPPDWVERDPKDRSNQLQFPYISLECLREICQIKNVILFDLGLREVVGIEVLQECPNLTTITINDEAAKLMRLDFSSKLHLPKLERIRIRTEVGNGLKQLNLSFLEHSTNLREVTIVGTVGSTDRKTGKKEGHLTLPAFDHALLEAIEIKYNMITMFSIGSPWKCPNLQTFDFITNNLWKLPDFDFPVLICRNLKRLNLWGNDLKKFDLSLIETCSNLQTLSLSSNGLQSLDLTPLQHCFDLRELSLSNNKLTELDLTPLRQCSALRKLNLAYNSLQALDLTPLQNCTTLEVLSLHDNPLPDIDLSPVRLLPNIRINFPNNK